MEKIIEFMLAVYHSADCGIEWFDWNIGGSVSSLNGIC